MNSTYYITQIERKLKALGLSFDAQEYNEIFDEKDDKKFVRKLRVFNEILNKRIDDKEMDAK